MASALVRPRSLEGKVIIVTGGNAGLGRAAAEALLKGCPKLLIVASRSSERGQAAVSQLRAKANGVGCSGTAVEFMQVDLSSKPSVTAFAEAFLARGEPLHILINNAGIYGVPHTKTAEGLEICLATNHFGPLLLTRLLAPALLAAGHGNARVVLVASRMEALARAIDWDDIGGKRTMVTDHHQYFTSKLYNVMTAESLSRRVFGPRGVVVVSCHPGFSRSRITSKSEKKCRLVPLFMYLASKVFAQSADRGASSMVYAAIADDIEGGAYYGPNGMNCGNTRRRFPKHRQARDPAAADRLVDESLRLLDAPPLDALSHTADIDRM